MSQAARRIGSIYKESFSGLPREIWLLSVAMLVNRAGTMVLPFLTLYLTQQMGYTTEEAGRLMGLYGLGSIAGSWLGGWAADRIDPNRVQVLSLLSAGVGFLILSALSTFLQLAIAIMLLAILADSFRPALFASAARYAPIGTRPRAFTLLRLAANLGMAIGPAMGGFLALHRYAWLFYGDALTCWAAALLMLRTLGRAPTLGTHADDGLALRRQSPWKDRTFLAFLGLVLLMAIIFFQILSTLPLYLHEGYGLPENAIGGLLAVNAILITIFEMPLVRSVERRNHLRVAAVGGLLVGLGMGVLPLGSSVWIALFSVLIWTFGEMLALPMTNVLAADRAAEGNVGSYVGAYMMSFAIALVLAPMIGTTIYERFGPNVLWLGCAVAGIIVGVGLRSLSGAFRSAVKAPSGDML